MVARNLTRGVVLHGACLMTAFIYEVIVQRDDCVNITLEFARGTNIPRRNIPSKGPPQIPKILYAN